MALGRTERRKESGGGGSGGGGVGVGVRRVGGGSRGGRKEIEVGEEAVRPFAGGAGGGIGGSTPCAAATGTTGGIECDGGFFVGLIVGRVREGCEPGGLAEANA